MAVIKEIVSISIRELLSGEKPLKDIHRNTVISLADELKVHIDRVQKLYCIVLARFARDAKIEDYLPILVARRVKVLIEKKMNAKSKGGND